MRGGILTDYTELWAPFYQHSPFCARPSDHFVEMANVNYGSFMQE